ncbi:MAG: acyl-CoA dehydrogenase family protein, partial [Candidatus Thermoplasmatota archaeon]|nr:acyl-CoA dehydrogenase family protein [Candidatus Thermoplasmatota archaeon]
MDFAETEEQQMIRDMVRDFAENVAAPTTVERDRAQLPPVAEFREFAGLGFAGMTIPEVYGGQKLDDVSEAIVVEELSRVDPSLGVMVAVHVGLCSMTIVLHGNDAQKEKYLPQLASGEMLGAYSLSEASSGTDAAAMSAKATDDGDCYVLNGEKMWVTNGSCADLFVLFAKVNDHPDYGKKKHGGVTAFIIEKGLDGFAVGKKEDKLGIRSSDTTT